jgi:hypothetical protein
LGVGVEILILKKGFFLGYVSVQSGFGLKSQKNGNYIRHKKVQTE